MASRSYGYSRISTSAQDWSLQLEALERAGVDDRDVFRETASGAKRDRDQLRRVLDLLRAGDRLCVYRLDRLARSQLHLLQIIEEIEGRGAKLVSLKDNIDTTTATGRMLVGMLAVLAEFERNLILERSAAGRAVARERQVKFGRPPKLTAALVRQVALAHEDASSTVAETCRMLGISRSSYYAALRAGRQALPDRPEAAPAA
ncbi:recombinase family protein [Methylobacterium longum]|uniref:Recombinase family protein n=1 Tax=Methylobacterium longum TaxID=767694 RepID=A0ABT8AR67_9HYPH|nr:recombinase family protein [Methylobacterium longum]MDN3572361.1 recombinase family protein [Methylobacterium longum]GJE09495.1 Transposon Tn3 resolvase [Methylobacterium longum]